MERSQARGGGGSGGTNLDAKLVTKAGLEADVACLTKSAAAGVRYPSTDNDDSIPRSLAGNEPRRVQFRVSDVRE